jgi:tetratricopeptide (TPR) repeat protein
VSHPDSKHRSGSGDLLGGHARFASAFVVVLSFLVAASAADQPASSIDQPVPISVPTENDELHPGSACLSFGLTNDREAIAICNRLDQAASADRWEDVRDLAHQLLERHPKNGVGYFWLGQASQKLGKYIAGVRHFRAAVDLSPEVSLAHLVLGLSYATIQQNKLFEDEMQWIIAHSPQEPSPYYYLGRYYSSDLKQPDKGIELFQQALLRNPNDYKSRYHLGHVFELKGEWAKAKVEYEVAATSVISQKSTYSWPWQGLARFHSQQENLSEAIRIGKEAVSMEPKQASSRLLLGKLYVQAGELRKGVEELKAATELDLTNATAHYWLSRAYSRMKMPAEAQRQQEIFAQLKAVYPDD